MSSGVVYIAYDKHKSTSHIKEAVISATSVKKLHPNLNISLFTDVDIKQDCFDNVLVVPIEGVRVKQIYLEQSPYDRTLFLDSDTKLINPLGDVFTILDRFDLAAAIDHERKSDWKSNVYPEYKAIPEAFSEFNSGVILFRKNTKTKKFFSSWRENYIQWCKLSGKLNDQPSFRVSLWQSDLDTHTLPPEFNIRTQSKRDNSTSIKPRIYHWHNMYDKSLVRKPQSF